VLNHFLLINLLAGFAPSRQDLIPCRYGSGRPGKGFHAPRLGLAFLLLVLLFALALPAGAQEFIPERVVFPITDFKPDIKHLAPFAVKFGTGFCLDPDCRFVGTNYHVAKVMGKYVRIKGVFSTHRYLDSDADDAGAQDINLAGGGSLKYTPAHDLAIYEMRHPVKNFHGIGFDADNLENNPEVDIYAYPLNWNPKRGLVHWHGKFIGKTHQGLLAFSYEEGRVSGGASGGIVVDNGTKKIVGILNGIGEGTDRVALAVPVGELSDFVTRAQPYLQASLFPTSVFVSPVAADLYPPYLWPRAESLSQRPMEPAEVVKLRRTAQHLAESMRNFTATETYAWGRDNREPEVTDAYETLIVDGAQRWRHQGNKKFYAYIPFPPLSNFIVPGAEWSELPRMVGTELNLKIHQAPDAVVGGRTIHVFQYGANIEDRACRFGSVTNLFFIHWKFYDCHGEVWVDESGIILRISEALDLVGSWHRWWGVMTYGWLEKDGMQYLVPVTISEQAEHKKTYWCRGLFTDYEMFGAKARLVLPTEPEPAQRSSLGAK
jgi:hypothetical protein